MTCAERWAARIMPPDLMMLMRHESIETTMRFCVGRNALKTAKTPWEARNQATFGNTQEKLGSYIPVEATKVGTATYLNK